MSEGSNILLESGTNELEIVMFNVGNGLFGINVLKVREIINPLPVTETPNSHPFVEGIIKLREEVIPVVDLARVLNFPPSEQPSQDKFIISELNKLKVAFHVHNVTKIHRISWKQIEKPSQLSQGEQAQTVGVVKLDEGMALLLDFEKIVVEISPESGVNVNSLKVLEPRDRSEKKIVAAEDSAVLRKLLSDTLSEAGYENVRFFENGQAAWNYLEGLANDPQKNPHEEVHLVLTDIEMPQMDGHHLTLKIKEDSRLANIPVVIFSSLITGDLFHKGEKVGANAQISKPEIVQLIEKIDELIL